VDLKQEGHKLTIQGSLTDRTLANEVTCDVEVSPGPLKHKRHKRSLISCIAGRSKTRASKIKCKVEVSPGPPRGPKVYHIQQPYGEDPR
jgi:hypothetical protein